MLTKLTLYALELVPLFGMARNGTGRWVAQIRLKRNGRLVYSRSRSFIKETVAGAWKTKRLAGLRAPSALGAAQHASVKVKRVLEWFQADYDGAAKFGRTKLSHINFLMGYEPLVSSVATDLR